MIYQNTETENTQNQFSNAIRQLQCGKLLRIDGRSSKEVFMVGGERVPISRKYAESFLENLQK